MIIREVASKDLSAISDIWNHYILNTSYNYDSEVKNENFFINWKEVQAKLGYPIYVLEVEGKVIGYATFGQFRSRNGYRFSLEHGVYLAPKVQGNGYGKALMQTLIKRAKRDGYHSMTAGIDTTNQGSINFHLKFGFKEVGRFPEIGFKNGEWLECVFLQLILK
ncbi:MAG: L-amino acid N-acyltransferase YncA [Arcticibacterium sp.]|jgi:L-amino acid N-acyltransferase YncA